MITYRDMTFCDNKNCKKDCYRKLTKEVCKKANEFGLPISVAIFDCDEEDNENNI